MNIYFVGRLQWEGWRFVYPDGLGSTVKVFPYGEEVGTSPAGRVKFVTYERDTYTGLDYAQNRYYARTIGRFTSPDPYQASGGPADPQSWNRYAYVQNDPVNFSDPDGLLAQSPESLAQMRGLNFSNLYPYNGQVGSGGLFRLAALDPDSDVSAELQREARFRQDLAGARRNRGKVKNSLRGAVPGASVFTADILDCMAGLESTWDLDRDGVGDAAGRTGLLQYNKKSWENEYNNSVPWSPGSAHDIALNVQVALGGLNGRLGIVQDKRPDLKTLDGQMARAITLWGDSKRFGDNYGAAIMECAKNIGTNFEAAYRSIWNLLNP